MELVGGGDACLQSQHLGGGDRKMRSSKSSWAIWWLCFETSSDDQNIPDLKSLKETLKANMFQQFTGEISIQTRRF